jgi:ubiquinone/menaquinone biosynthesis C-methylase UbiE
MSNFRHFVQALARGVRRTATEPSLAGIEYWEKRANDYGRRSVLHMGHAESEYDDVTRMQEREIFPHLRTQLNGTERTVLDFGCGPGRFTVQLAEAIRGKAIGVDPIIKLLELAPQHPHVEYRVLKENVIPVADNSVDVVWTCLVLGGINGHTLDQAISELGRVLAPGGLLFVVENTSNKADQDTWKFRSVFEYTRKLPFVALVHLHDYVDLGETISIMAGRRI